MYLVSGKGLLLGSMGIIMLDLLLIVELGVVTVIVLYKGMNIIFIL